ncbi:MAG: molybdopterin-dependent oxidoreductase [Candidatus Methanofastidiosia archaeon]
MEEVIFENDKKRIQNVQSIREAIKITRRTFLKGITTAGGSILAGNFLFGELETLVFASSENIAIQEDWVPTTCWIGKQECGMFARCINGRVVKFEGHPEHPRNRGTLCPKGMSQIISLYDPNRVKTPLVRTNEKGIAGKWRKASWDEALTLVAEKIKEVRERDSRLLIWQKGRSKAKNFYDTAFVNASGATKLHHGGFCSDAGYRACEYTIGLHGVLHPDFRNTRYLLSWGWNITNSGGNKLCWITWPQQLVAAKERGMKVVAIDPRLRGAGPFADDWLPIRPGADMALALALCNALIEQGTIDIEYLKKYTNAPFLVKEDGYFLKIGDNEQVWDLNTNSSKPYDTQGVDPALEGEFMVDGTKVKPVFQIFKEHVSQYTPEWASDICGIKSKVIRRVAKELGENAMIGSTIIVDGVTLPYRPVAIMAYHMAQQELGFQSVRAMLMVTMLLGSVGAVGGQFSDFTWKVHKNYKKLDEIKIKDPPYNIYLKDSKFFPINSNNSSMVAKVMLEPEKYEVNYTPEVLIVHMANPVVSFVSQQDIIDSYKKFKFIAVIDPWLSKTADYFADVVLPAATIEKYEGPMGVTDQYTDAVALRLPPIEPLFDSRGDIDIYIDLCEKAGILYGEDGYLDEVGKALKLKEPYGLPLDKKPSVREIFDRWAKSEGIEEGIKYFEKNGVNIKGPVSATKYYGYAANPPFGGIYHRLYGESLLHYRDQMKAKGVKEIYWQNYTPLPTWRNPSMNGSPSEYDLYLISYKMIEFKQSRASQIPLLVELAPKQWLEINSKTAKAKGINDGDEVWVESHNAVTGETRKVKVTARHCECIRPDTVGMPHHYGEVANHPWAEGQGPTANSLFFTGEGYIANTADQSFHVKVRVYKT